MSLASLKRLGPSAKQPKPAISLDDFIQDAERYAKGQSPKVVALRSKNSVKQSSNRSKRATFTLGDKAIAQLNALAEQTGNNKSRLIRIWLDSLSEQEIKKYKASKSG